MLIDALTALQDWAPVAALRHSRWTYASVNAAHIIGMARALLPVAIAGLVLAVVAGLGLFSIRAVKYAGTGLFQVKMALLACALTNALLLKRAAQWEAQQAKVGVAPPLRMRLAGALSIVLWLSVIVCGRMLAFVD
jgi:hypothetical protein